MGKICAQKVQELIVAFIGPDGCGKTTLIEGLANELSDKHHIVMHEMNYRALPRLASLASVLLGRQAPKDHAPGEYLVGMANPPLGILKASVYILYYSLDYALGRRRIKSLSNKSVILFSRYAYDYQYQHAYSRIPRVLRRLPAIFAVRPDLVITIHRSAEVIHAQKPELSVEEIKRQQYEIDMLIRPNENFLRIDGNQGVIPTLNKAIAALGHFED
jgi:thymidylate kinase